MSEQQRERETVSRDKESIGQAQAAVGCVAALCCVCVGLPRVWGARDHPPPLSSLRHRFETKTEAGQREQTPECYTTCAETTAQTTTGQFSGNIPSASLTTAI